jgi:hypothetical protein
LGSLDLVQFLSKIVGQNGIPVRDNKMRHVMKFEDIVHENLSHYGCGEWVLNIIEINIFGNMINYHHDE